MRVGTSHSPQTVHRPSHEVTSQIKQKIFDWPRWRAPEPFDETVSGCSSRRSKRHHYTNNEPHVMSTSCAPVPRAVRAPRSREVRSARAGACNAEFSAPDGRRVAARLGHPLRASAPPIASARWVTSRHFVVLRASDPKRAASFSVEDKEDGDVSGAIDVSAIVVEASSDPNTDTDGPEKKQNTLDDDGVPLDDDGPCTVTEEGDEVCVLPFGNPPPGETDEPDTTNDTSKAAIEDNDIALMTNEESNFPTDRAALLMSGALPSDDAVIASTLGATPEEFFTLSSATVSTPKLWWRALKLPMYSVAVAPLTTAMALCHHWFGCVHVPQFVQFLTGACLIIAWLNLSNDAWDASTGVDANKKGGKPESVVNLLGGGTNAVMATHGAAVACLVTGFLSLYKATQFAVTNGTATASVLPTAGAMLLLSVLLGHAYQGPPFRLSYKGLGEPICFTSFGPLAVGAFYLLLASGVPGGSVWSGAASGLVSASSLLHPGVLGAAALIGSTTTVILFASHLHQEQGDKAAGKMSPIVRLGVVKAVDVLKKGLMAHHVIAVALAAAGLLPIMGAVGVLLALPLAAVAGEFASDNQATPEKLFKTKYLAVRWHIIHAFLLGCGIWLDQWMPWYWQRVAGAAVDMMVV